MNDDILVIQCFDRWWIYDQSIYKDPPKIPQDVLELASIVYYVPTKRTIKNRHNADFENMLRMKIWLGESWPSIDDRAFRDAYVDYIAAVNASLVRIK